MNHLEFHNAEVVDIIHVTPLLRRFFLRFDHPVIFKSGQFVIIDFGELPHQFATRSYSIADFTDGPVIELCVVLKDDGAATPILFDQKIGDVLRVSEPQGRFVLPDELPEKPIGFICTGTGVAPFRAMIKDLLLHRHFKHTIHLFYGSRTVDTLLYREEFELLALKFPNFKYTPVLSREKWEGASGYVHEHYHPVFCDKPDALLFLCGWTEMLKETRNKLKEYGYGRSDIRVEFYD